MALLVTGVAGCNRSTKPTGTVTVLVTDKLVPIGKAADAAISDGSIKATTVPADVAPSDAIERVEDIRCLVPSQGIPAGTLLRRSMFVKPSELGLDQGLSVDPALVVPCQ
jgi:hypothetical protein